MSRRKQTNMLIKYCISIKTYTYTCYINVTIPIIIVPSLCGYKQFNHVQCGQKVRPLFVFFRRICKFKNVKIFNVFVDQIFLSL